MLVWFYSFGFVLITAILLLNMLIGMMAKTFDNVWEGVEVNYQFLFARLVVGQQQRPPTPPPLNLLHTPTSFLALVIRVISVAVPAQSSCNRLLDDARAAVDSAFEYSTLLMRSSNSPWLQLNVACEPSVKWGDFLWGEYKGTETPWNGRNSWEAWCFSMSTGEFEDAIVEFVFGHQDDGIDERWRSKLARQITKQRRETKLQICELAEGLRELHQAVVGGRAGPNGLSPGSTQLDKDLTA